DRSYVDRVHASLRAAWAAPVAGDDADAGDVAWGTVERRSVPRRGRWIVTVALVVAAAVVAVALVIARSRSSDHPAPVDTNVPRRWAGDGSFTLPVSGNEVDQLALVDGRLWVERTSGVVVIDPDSGTTVARFDGARLGSDPLSLAIGWGVADRDH